MNQPKVPPARRVVRELGGGNPSIEQASERIAVLRESVQKLGDRNRRVFE